jgi:TonB family protein
VFTKRLLGISILISTAWHLFWIFAIGIVVTPTVETTNLYNQVEFLGPILEKTAFDLMTEDINPQSETLYATSSLFGGEFVLRPKGPDRKILMETAPINTPDKFFFILRDYIKSSEKASLYLIDDPATRYMEDDKDKKIDSFIEGPAGEREIIFQSNPITVPKGLYGKNDEYFVRLRFILSNNGIVREIQPILSSGYPEIDLLAVNMLKKWRFSPLSSNKKDNEAWGAVVIRIYSE